MGELLTKRCENDKCKSKVLGHEGKMLISNFTESEEYDDGYKPICKKCELKQYDAEMARYRAIERSVVYARERKRRDQVFMFSIQCRSNICNAFSRGGLKKGTKTEKILGCTIDQFREHIISQFKPGMTLENHGEWHLDHVIPVNRAMKGGLFTVEELCHYTNYQPLWARDNLSKHSK